MDMWATYDIYLQICCYYKLVLAEPVGEVEVVHPGDAGSRLSAHLKWKMKENCN